MKLKVLLLGAFSALTLVASPVDAATYTSNLEVSSPKLHEGTLQANSFKLKEFKKYKKFKKFKKFHHHYHG